LPCDDPEWSKFTRFFAENFERLGLKKLISTSYAAASKKIFVATKDTKKHKGEGGLCDLCDLCGRKPLWYQPSLFEQQNPHFDAKKTAVRGKIFVLDHDTNANGRIDLDDLQWNYMEGDGDFRSAEVCRLRDEADVIVTNPPFSLFREFLSWILAAKDAKSTKQFLIIGNMNTINTKDVFPLVVAGRLWLGATGNGSDMVFAVPEGSYVEPKETKAVYAKQTATAEKKGISNCPLCAIGHDANAKRIWKFNEMDADHVTPWSKGGVTDIKNCQMLCRTHNQAKGNR